MVPYEKRQKIIAQALKEILFARSYKQGRITSWQLNENMYYAKKQLDSTNYNTSYNSQITQPQGDKATRANVELGKMQAFVHTLLAKIDSPLTFKFEKNSLADNKKAQLLNALKEKDSNRDDWNFKDLMGKKQAILYGRAIFSYYADSIEGYKPHLENVDVYDFLIDPNAGGYDIDNALYVGRYGVMKNKQQIAEGVKKGLYNRVEAQKLLSGSGNYSEYTDQEDTNKQNRYSYVGSPYNRTIDNTNIYKLWEWYTTYDGERYYILLEETGGCALRCEKLADLFPIDDNIGQPMYPFWSWACYPDLTEFWTPSFCDYVREIFMAQNVCINQMLDNSDRINKPQRAVDVTAIENPADLIYRRNGIIRMKAGVDINKAFQRVDTPELNSPLLVYDALQSIVDVESGVSAATRGVASEDKVGIYEGNQAETADRFGLLNKSYSQGYKRFARLWRNGVHDHLSAKTSVKILGSDGLEKSAFISRKDLKTYAELDTIIESSEAESSSDTIDKKNKLTFLASYTGSPIINPRTKFEIEATIAGFTNDEIRELLNTDSYADIDLIGEADRDIEELLNLKVIQPNARANEAYAEHIHNYMQDHQEDMTMDQFNNFLAYMESITDTIIRNQAMRLQDEQNTAIQNSVQNSQMSQASLEEIQPNNGQNTNNNLDLQYVA